MDLLTGTVERMVQKVSLTYWFLLESLPHTLPASSMNTSRRMMRVKAQPAMPRAKPDQGLCTNQSIKQMAKQKAILITKPARI